jgi:hypothetical protein
MMQNHKKFKFNNDHLPPLIFKLDHDEHQLGEPVRKLLWLNIQAHNLRDELKYAKKLFPEIKNQVMLAEAPF